MERVGEHPVPAGPLAVRWRAYELPRLRAGRVDPARLVLENAGGVRWPELLVSYHWLDRLGNPIVWEGLRTPGPRLEPGEQAEVTAHVRGPMPPGPYRLSWDLVVERRWWFSEIGNVTLDVDVDVEPRIGRALAVRGAGDAGAPIIAVQEEPLVDERDAEAVVLLAPGWEPATSDWSRLILDAHQEGYALVGGSVEARDTVLRAYDPRGGRQPAFPHPLVFPSLVVGVAPDRFEEVAGLPASPHLVHDPWIYDARIRTRRARGR